MTIDDGWADYPIPTAAPVADSPNHVSAECPVCHPLRFLSMGDAKAAGQYDVWMKAQSSFVEHPWKCDLPTFIKLTSKVDGTSVYIRREVVDCVKPGNRKEGETAFTSVEYHAGNDWAGVYVVESADEVMGKLLGKIR